MELATPRRSWPFRAKAPAGLFWLITALASCTAATLREACDVSAEPSEPAPPRVGHSLRERTPISAPPEVKVEQEGASAEVKEGAEQDSMQAHSEAEEGSPQGGTEEEPAMPVCTDASTSPAAGTIPESQSASLAQESQGAPSLPPAESVVQPSLGAIDAIDQEISELEELIRLQNQKVAALSALRQAYIRTGSLEGVVPRREVRLASGEGNDWLPEGIRGGSRSEAHEDYLVKLGSINITNDVTAVKVLTFQMVKEGPRQYKHPKSNQPVYKMVSVVALAGRGGTLWIYDLNGEPMAEYQTGHQASITAIAFEGNDDPLLATAAADGSVRVHNASLWKNDVMVAGRRPRVPRSSLTEGEHPGGIDALKAVYVKPPEVKTSLGYGMQLNLEMVLADGDISSSVDESEGGNCSTAGGQGSSSSSMRASRVLSALVYRHRTSGRTIVTGDAEGIIRFHNRNGTLVKVLHTDQPIWALEKNGLVIAYPHHKDVHLLGAFSMEPTGTNCIGRHGPVKSFAFDIVQQGILHVATDHGDILMFDTKEKVLEDKTMYPLIRKITSKRGLPVFLGSVRGYLLAASSAGLSVYNTTGLRHSLTDPVPLVFHYQAPSLTSPPLFSVSYSRVISHLPSSFVLPLQPSPHDGLPPRLVIFESLLPFSRPKPLDLMWIRAPIMILALVVVFLWQLSKQKNKVDSTRSRSRPMASGRPSSAFAAAGMRDDMDFVRSSMQGMTGKVDAARAGGVYSHGDGEGAGRDPQAMYNRRGVSRHSRHSSIGDELNVNDWD